jgi:hypothetical protein
MVLENYIFWMLTLAYAIHIAEEYFMDWRSWTMQISGLEMKLHEFAIANAIVIVLGITASIIGFSRPLVSYLFVGLAATNAVIAHLATTIAKKRFSPGLISSLALFIPLSVWAYYIAEKKGLLTVELLVVSLLGGVAITSVPVIFQLLKSRRH